MVAQQCDDRGWAHPHGYSNSKDKVGGRVRKSCEGDMRACHRDVGTVCQGRTLLDFKGKHTVAVGAVIHCVTALKAAVQIKQGSGLCVASHISRCHYSEEHNICDI